MSSKEYTIRTYDHGGIAIFGAIPIADLASLFRFWGERDMTLFAGIATALGANVVVATPEVAEKWLAQLKADAGPDWLHAGDTGISSRTIYSVMANAPQLLNQCDAGVPHDAADFERCYRLLAARPGWRKRLGEVSARFPEWTPFVREWDELESLYEDGDSRQWLNAMIRRLVDEGHAK